MAKVQTEHVFNGGLDQVYAALRSYHKYPEYLPAITSIDVLPAKETDTTCQVRYELNLIKKFFYTLNMYEDPRGRIWWTLDDSNLMKSNDGSWELSALGKDKTKAVYSLDVRFKGLVPSAITDQAAKANLPSMMLGFQKMIDAAAQK